MSSGGDIMFAGPMCSWKIPECSASALAVLAGFLNSALEQPPTGIKKKLSEYQEIVNSPHQSQQQLSTSNSKL